MAEFTIRVHAIIMNDDRLLLSRERIQGKWIVKFPGGGLEFGEGTRDCLKRELKEELGLDSEILDHFYTTDYFQLSAFHSTPTQVLSIYYTAVVKQAELLKIVGKNCLEEGVYWLPISDCAEEEVSLPIDQSVLEKIIAQGSV